MSARLRVSFGTVPTLQTFMHRLAQWINIFVAGPSSLPATSAFASLRRYTCRETMAMITMAAQRRRPWPQTEDIVPWKSHRIAGGNLVARLPEDATRLCSARCRIDIALASP